MKLFKKYIFWDEETRRHVEKYKLTPLGDMLSLSTAAIVVFFIIKSVFRL